MTGSDVYFYDIAAVAIYFILLASILVRRRMFGPANRVFLSAVILAALTALAGLGADLFDEFVAPQLANVGSAETTGLITARNAIEVAYYTLRTLTAPAYLVLISAVCDTSHRLNNGPVARFFLWVPMIFAAMFVLLNPLHHLIFHYDGAANVRGPLIGIIYGSALYYSVIGIWWLFRWRPVMTGDMFPTLMLIYPLALLAVIIQYFYPFLHVEMFFTSISLLMVSTFVLRPDYQLDSLVDAASLNAYRDLCRRAALTEKPLCLVYLEIIDIERLRELVGKDEFHGIVAGMAKTLSGSLSRGDVLYYLRNGLFCIVPARPDANQAVYVAQTTHEMGKEQARKISTARAPLVRMRTCVVRMPEDVTTPEELSTFVRRFSHLVPESHVTTFSALSQQDNFALNMALPSLVERAIRERAFQIYYQPIYSVYDGGFHSAEALVRLYDPTFGWIPPALFVPEAEQSGAIVQIGSILFEKICAFLAHADFDAWGLAYVEVNLSVDQCIQPRLSNELLAVMEQYRVDPARFNLEITETSSAFSQEVIDRNVHALAAAGTTFSLDDYGAGYSNVTRALRLPFSLIKFDKSFVDALDDTATRTVLEQSIAMMRSIGKCVLVEGVETQEQADALRAMGVDYIQGYRYAKPLAEDEFVDFLLAHNQSAGA